ncbi:hypothetical protein BSIN_1701 [Burkholderia singularis]|uniref:Uncharacterized protein n=1 Tax=Burkholderia singularis TaxID=1503053 RepID=A0A238GZL6_9BURK|nr:hypothetical protein BSIN_1701 [Burkholderia singularis]
MGAWANGKAAHAPGALPRAFLAPPAIDADAVHPDNAAF